MRKLFLALLFTVAGFTFLHAQDTNNQQDQPLLQGKAQWKTSGILSGAYNQTAVSDNWTGKETYSRVWQAKLFLSAERDSIKSNWKTTFKEEYGENDTKDTSEISLDYLEVNSVYTYKIYKLLQPYASFFVQSQNNEFWDPVTYIESVV